MMFKADWKIALLLYMCPLVMMQGNRPSRTPMDEFTRPRTVLSSTAPFKGDVSSQCLQDLTSLLDNTNLIPVLDSFGKPTPGMLVGNLAWLGNFDECMGVTDYRYCLLSIAVNLTAAVNVSLELPIQWGVCVPESCSEDDVRNSMELLIEYLNVSWLTLEGVLGSSAHCIDKPNTDFNGGFICVCILLCLLSVLCVSGSILDHVLQARAVETGESSLPHTTPAVHTAQQADQTMYTSLDEKNRAGNADRMHHSEKTPLLCHPEKSPATLALSDPSPGATGKAEQSIWTRLLLCFAISRNLPKILSAKQAEGGITCLNGIRVISMSWVILGHTLALVAAAGLSENLLSAFPKWMNSFGYQAILNAYFSVDSFFFLSGLLLTYLTLKKMKATGGKIPWGWFYVHRYLRLTPAIGMLILISMYILPNMSQGPVWHIVDYSVEICRSWWWTTVLYINNLFPPAMSQGCVPWTWYLANDMQFFLISPIVIVPLFWYPVVGFVILGLLCTVSFITSSVLVHQHGFGPGVFQLGEDSNPVMNPEPQGAYLSSDAYMDVVYTKPYCRIPPYLVGMVMGYLIYRIGSRKIKVSPVMTAAGWAMASALGIAVVYGLYGQNSGAVAPTVAAGMAYASLSTFTWAVALSWVVFACHYGYGGVIDDFLSWSVWIPFSRLTYSAYLLHPIVIQLYAYSLAVPVHWSSITVAYNFAAFLLLAYASSLLMNLLVEFPFGNLEKILQQALSSKNP